MAETFIVGRLAFCVRCHMVPDEDCRDGQCEPCTPSGKGCVGPGCVGWKGVRNRRRWHLMDLERAKAVIIDALNAWPKPADGVGPAGLSDDFKTWIFMQDVAGAFQLGRLSLAQPPCICKGVAPNKACPQHGPSGSAGRDA